MNGWALVLALLLMAVAQHMVLSRVSLKGMKYTRRFSKKTAFEGEEAELVEVIRNDRPLFIPWFRAESRISPYLHFGRQENLSPFCYLYFYTQRHPRWSVTLDPHI